MTYGLGRIAAPDDRDAAYPLRALVRVDMPARRSYTWRTGPVRDQGDTPECVGYSWREWLDASPIRDKPTGPPTPADIYRMAQAVDEWKGMPHDGTSVRAGAKVMQQQGRIASYHWATSIEDIRAYILTTGPVVLGTDWYEGMFALDSGGFARPVGNLAGGHAYLCIGYSSAKKAFRCLNSWGHWWGENAGKFWLHADELQRLLDANGEACAAAERRV